jgi:hypothetical protein
MVLEKNEKQLQVACVNLASCMTNILLEQSDHEDKQIATVKKNRL